MVGVKHGEVVFPGDRLGGCVEVDRHVELLERLLAHQLDQILGQHLGVTGYVEDPLLWVERGQLASELRERVDDPRGGLSHACPEGGAHPDRPGADHGDVANLVDVLLDGGAHGVSVTVSAAPSKAPNARSTEHEMQVNVGVSRNV